MKFQKIEKKETGHFITRYDITYKIDEDNKKVYEMISRDSNIKNESDILSNSPDAVVIIVTDESNERILINKEFRLAVDDWVYNFPAGLIDSGETPEIAAKRELAEETGLSLYQIDFILPLSYSAVGFSNETNVCIIGKAKGNFAKSTSDVEEIKAQWYTKDEVRKLLKTEKFAARTQAYCYLWCGK